MSGDDSQGGGPPLGADTVGAVASAAAEAAAKKRKVKRRDLKAKIRELEAEIEETRSQVPDEPLYGMTPKLEAAVIRALAQEIGVQTPKYTLQKFVQTKMFKVRYAIERDQRRFPVSISTAASIVRVPCRTYSLLHALGFFDLRSRSGCVRSSA